MIGATRRWLRGWVPVIWGLRRQVRLSVVSDLGSSAALWELQVTRAPGGSGGLIPDERMTITPDAAFAKAVADAAEWAQARRGTYRGADRQWTITWCLYDDTGAPASGPVRGGSLGAAMGTALAYLLGLGWPARRRVDPRAVISAGLDQDGELLPVAGLETKVRAVGSTGARLLVADADERAAIDARGGEHPAISAGSKAVDALRFTAAPRHRSVPLTAAALLVVVVSLSWAGLHHLDSVRAQRAQLTEELIARSRGNLPNDPAASAFTAVAAAKLEPANTAAQASLLATSTTDSRYAGVLVAKTTAVAISQDGTLVASGSTGHRITLSRTDRGAPTQTAHMDGSAVAALAFTSDNRTLISVDDRGTVARWDVATLTSVVLRRPSPYVQPTSALLTVSPDGQLAAIAFDGSQIWLFDLISLAPPLENRFNSGIAAIAFSTPRTLAVGVVGSKGTDQLLAFDTDKFMDKPRIVASGRATIAITGISALALSADGRTLVSGGLDGAVAIWDAASLTRRDSFDTTNSVIGLAIDRSGTRALVTRVAGLGLSPQIDRDAGGATIELWDLERKEAAGAELAGPFVSGVVVADTTLDTAVVRTTNGSATLWHDLGGEELRQDGIVSDVRPDPLAPSTVVTAGVGGRIDFIDAAAGKIVKSLPANEHEGVAGLDISSSGTLLVTVHHNGSVLLRDRNTGAVTKELRPPSEKPVYRVSFSPRGDLVAAGGGDGVVRLWNTSTGAELRHWTTGANIIQQVAFDATGGRVYVIESRAAAGAVSGGMWWAAVDSDEIHDRQDAEFPGRGMAVLSADRVLVGDGDGTLRVTDGRLLPVPQLVPFRHQANVLALAYSRTANRIISGGGDNVSAVLEPGELSVLAQLPGTDPGDFSRTGSGIYAVGVTSDGRYAVAGSYHGRIQVFPLAADLLSDRACHLAGRVATPADLGLTAAERTLVELPC